MAEITRMQVILRGVVYIAYILYAIKNKAFIESSDIELNKSANLRTDVVIDGEVDPQSLGLQFINHIS